MLVVHRLKGYLLSKEAADPVFGILMVTQANRKQNMSTRRDFQGLSIGKVRKPSLTPVAK